MSIKHSPPEIKVITAQREVVLKPARYNKEGVLLPPQKKIEEFEKTTWIVKTVNGNGFEEHEFLTQEDANRYYEGLR